MAGMEGLGRLFNVVPIAAGVAINLNQSSAVTFVCTGNDTFTATVASSFSASYVTPPTTTIGGGLIRNYYTNTATNGTAAWVKTALASGSYSNSETISSGSLVFTVYGTDLDVQAIGGTNYQYIKVSVGSSGLVAAIVHDLTVQRTPANLELLSA
jgi:hypothetical protein